MSALRHLVDYQQFRKSGKRWIRKSPIGFLHIPSFRPEFSTEAAFRLLDSFGIPVVPTLLTRNADEATSASEASASQSFLRSSRPKSPTRATSAVLN